jgi:hypothetical protein
VHCAASTCRKFLKRALKPINPLLGIARDSPDGSRRAPSRAAEWGCTRGPHVEPAKSKKAARRRPGVSTTNAKRAQLQLPAGEFCRSLSRTPQFPGVATVNFVRPGGARAAPSPYRVCGFRLSCRFPHVPLDRGCTGRPTVRRMPSPRVLPTADVPAASPRAGIQNFQPSRKRRSSWRPVQAAVAFSQCLAASTPWSHA